MSNIRIRNENLTEVRNISRLAELAMQKDGLGTPCAVLVFMNETFTDDRVPEVREFFRNAPFLTVLIPDAPDDVHVSLAKLFDFMMTAEEADTYFNQAFAGKTAVQCREITDCFLKSRNGSPEDVLAQESKAFYRLMHLKNQEQEDAPEQNVPENQEDAFQLEEQDGILYLLMNANGNNIMTESFFRYYEAVMEKIETLAQEKNYKGLIIRGKGRHFSVGADVTALAERSAKEVFDEETQTLPESHLRQKHFFTFLHELPFPVVSVVTGFCIGSGSEIAVNSHFRICEKGARIGQPESTFGILPALGGLGRTLEICGLKQAYQLVMTGELFPAEQAYEIRWADILTDKKKGLAEAEALIRSISEEAEDFNSADCKKYLNHYLRRKESETA